MVWPRGSDRHKGPLARSIFFAMALILATVIAPAKSQIVEVKLGTRIFKVEVVQTEQDRARGMMFRRDFGEAEGMLFVFRDEDTRTFWMKNTYIPLSIGFFDAKFKLLDIQEMEPARSDIQSVFPQYTSSGPAQYALEVPRGWFSQHKIKVGAKLKGKNSPRPKLDATHEVPAK